MFFHASRLDMLLFGIGAQGEVAGIIASLHYLYGSLIFSKTFRRANGGRCVRFAWRYDGAESRLLSVGERIPNTSGLTSSTRNVLE